LSCGIRESTETTYNVSQRSWSQSQNSKQFVFDFHKERAEIVAESSDELKIKLGEFAGPLDLLLFLIRQEPGEHFRYPDLTDHGRISHLHPLDEEPRHRGRGRFSRYGGDADREQVENAASPRDPDGAGGKEIEDPRKELIDRLLEYEKFKAAAEMLHEKSTVEHAVFQRGKIESDEANAEISATVFDIISVFQKILVRHRDEIKMEIAT
jgi:segregation and condensation protein A